MRKSKKTNWLFYSLTGILLMAFVNNAFLHPAISKHSYYESAEDLAEEFELQEGNEVEESIFYMFAGIVPDYSSFDCCNHFITTCINLKGDFTFSFNSEPLYILYHSLVIHH